MRELEMTGKTVEDALEAACAQLGVDRDDLNLSYEVLEFPAKKLFKTIPARVKVTLEEDVVVEEAVAEPLAVPHAAPAAAPAPRAAAPVQAAQAPAQPAPKANRVEEPLVDEPLEIEGDARLTAAIDYLTPIFTLMGAENLSYTALRRGEATIIKVGGDHVGALIGRRGETMESLSYLASLVVNRMEGSYMKLGLDVAGYRDKREEDLSALTGRICDRVKKTGYSYEMEPMNPYERHIIHSAVSKLDGVRSESKGDGQDRRVVIYSTDPNASNQPDREARSRRGSGSNARQGGRGGYNANRGGRGGYGGNRSGGYNRDGNRGGYNRDGGSRSGGGYHSGPRQGGYAKPSSVPPRTFAETPHDPTQKPQAPERSERIHDGDDFELFGKIEL